MLICRDYWKLRIEQDPNKHLSTFQMEKFEICSTLKVSTTTGKYKPNSPDGLNLQHQAPDKGKKMLISTTVLYK